MISRDTVLHVARLARLQFSEEEIDALAGELTSILEYVDQLSAVNTDHVEPTAFLDPEYDPLRNDIPEKSLAVDETLANAPGVKGNYFAIPKVIQQ